jgi:hypothetical protein
MASLIQRRPPDRQLLGYLTAYDRTIADLALALGGIILEEAPGASESIYQPRLPTRRDASRS